MSNYIDFHTHLDFYKKEELKKVIEDINKNNIKTISCAMDEDSYKSNLLISKESENIISTFGIHPWKASKHIKELDIFDEYIQESKLIGEVGLDFYWAEDKSSYPNQIEIFKYFLKKAKEYDKYINIHTKGAEEEVYNLIRKYDISEKSIIHWYSGDIYNLKQLIDAKCYFTSSVDINYSEISREVIKLVPKDKILTETDGPTALEWINGKSAMPTEIINVYNNVCNVKNIEVDELLELTNTAYKKIIK